MFKPFLTQKSLSLNIACAVLLLGKVLSLASIQATILTPIFRMTELSFEVGPIYEERNRQIFWLALVLVGWVWRWPWLGFLAALFHLSDFFHFIPTLTGSFILSQNAIVATKSFYLAGFGELFAASGSLALFILCHKDLVLWLEHGLKTKKGIFLNRRDFRFAPFKSNQMMLFLACMLQIPFLFSATELLNAITFIVGFTFGTGYLCWMIFQGYVRSVLLMLLFFPFWINDLVDLIAVFQGVNFSSWSFWLLVLYIMILYNLAASMVFLAFGKRTILPS